MKKLVIGMMMLVLGAVSFGEKKDLYMRLADKNNEFILIEIGEAKNSQSEENIKNSKRGFHRVKSGETLIQIAKKYNTSVEKLKKVNVLENIDRIGVGEKIYLEEADEKEE